MGCTSVSGTACIFPFRHLGITYTSCATTSDMADPWCSTATQEDGTHIQGNEGVCPTTCPGATATTTTTTTTTPASTTTTASTSTTTSASTTTTVSTTTTTTTTTSTTTS